MELAAAILAAVAAVVALVVALRARGGAPADDAAQAVRNDLNALRESNNRSIDLIAKQVSAIAGNVQTALEAVRSDFGNRLDALNKNVADRLGENVSAMSSTAKSVNDRIANVQATFAGLQKQVGEMNEQARQIAELSKTIADLQRILSSPKMRGGFGEAQLEALLGQVFARELYEMQHAFRSGDVADAVLKFPQGLVAIDSKFPLENFRRIADAGGEPEKKAARREFLKDVRKRIDEIASKYIRPEEGTLPFALAYIPAENVYYEAIIRDEEGNDLYAYCIDRRVFPVSPNSLYAYLHTIVVGLNGMRISERAESILREIESLRVELGKFTDDYATLGKHLRNATTKYDESTKMLNKVETRVQGLSNHKGEQLSLLEEEARRKALGAGE